MWKKIKPWHIIVAVLVITAIILISMNWTWITTKLKSLKSKSGTGTQRTTVTPAPTGTVARRLQDKASSISNRIGALVTETNRQLQAYGGMIIADDDKGNPVVNAPKGTCRCWKFFIFSFWSVECCNPFGRTSSNPQQDFILNNFKVQYTALNNEILALERETDTVLPSDPRSPKSCPCWCVTLLGISIICKYKGRCCTVNE